MADTNTDNDSDTPVPSPKRHKEGEQQSSIKKFTGVAVYKSSFRAVWQKKWPCITPVKTDPHSFHCTICFKALSCGHQGERDVTRHIASVQHQRNAKAVKSTPTITSFASSSSVNDKVHAGWVVIFTAVFEII